MSDILLRSYNGASATDRGTPIVKPGEDMDKDAFLKILSAELQNLDPTGNNDSTQYVTQMAQFASMEQMSNLNTTMADSSAYSLVGKGVTLDVVDSEGVPYTGVVAGVSSNGNSYKVSVELNINGKNEYKDFDISNIMTVLEVPDYSIPPLTNMNGNISMLVASAFIGKNVELSEQIEVDGEKVNITGEVLGVVKKDGQIYIKVKKDSDGEVSEYLYDKVINVSQESINKPEEGTEEE